MRTRWVAFAATIFTIVLIRGVLLTHAQSPQPTVQSTTAKYGTEADYGYSDLTPEQREGRNTWYFWTGGNQKFWVKMAELTEGNVNLLAYVDSRLHGTRFATLGAITQPGCRAATGPDKYGLWMDQCDQPPVPGVPGAPSGITGLRRFDNPDFNPANWNADTYLKNPGTMQPPYLIGMTCGFCHIGFNPLNPPDNPELPLWANLAGTIGNQFWEEGRLFNLRMPPTDFRWHVGNRQPAGTSDTSRFATDHINNPNAINSIFNLEFRPTQVEQMADGSMQPVHHILKEGADSIGIAGASLRVFVNIGMCSDYWITLHDPVMGRTRQKPFDIAYARANCADWRATEARMANAETFLKTMRPMHVGDAPGGSAYLTADAETLQRGKIAFADKCAQCHSSKQPPADVAADLARANAWYRESVLSADFLERNFLSDDKRYPVSLLGTNIARAMATNATAEGVWAQFSSVTYKNQKPIGRIRNLYNPRDPERPDRLRPARGRARVLPHADPHLDVGNRAVSAQQRARHLHQGSVGPRPHARLPGRDREAAVARAPAWRAVDRRHVDRQRAAYSQPRPAGARPCGHAGRFDRARRSTRSAGDRAQPRRAESDLGQGAVPRVRAPQSGARFRARSRPRVRRRAARRRQARADCVLEDILITVRLSGHYCGAGTVRMA